MTERDRCSFCAGLLQYNMCTNPRCPHKGKRVHMTPAAGTPLPQDIVAALRQEIALKDQIIAQRDARISELEAELARLRRC